MTAEVDFMACRIGSYLGEGNAGSSGKGWLITTPEGPDLVLSLIARGDRWWAGKDIATIRMASWTIDRENGWGSDGRLPLKRSFQDLFSAELPEGLAMPTSEPIQHGEALLTLVKEQASTPIRCKNGTVQALYRLCQEIADITGEDVSFSAAPGETGKAILIFPKRSPNIRIFGHMKEYFEPAGLRPTVVADNVPGSQHVRFLPTRRRLMSRIFAPVARNCPATAHERLSAFDNIIGFYEEAQATLQLGDAEIEDCIQELRGWGT